MPITSDIQAQIENIPISKEVKIERFYAGFLTYWGSPKNTSDKNLSSIQLGTRVNFLLIPKTFQVRAFGVFKQTQRSDLQFLRSYEAIFTPDRAIAIHLGVMATPTTELRPNPTTWQSQIETNAEKSIIGGRIGLKINYDLNQNLKLSYGLHKHDNTIVHHLKVVYKRLTVSSYLDDGNLFSAAKWQYSNGNVLITRFKNITSISSIISISKYYKIYADVAYNDSTQNTTYLELGIRRGFSNNYFIKGFLSLNYNHIFKRFQGGFFIHI
ncbi:hypothetical protein [uncultured Aquimarina sp.]|uniref:hypothetical protein n=1 Tax=uncultured Aquimarina sp. TaxID=575652 RepID=UPI002606597B|nr:hypothetical protein [uncultured Aquimarina sp.]